ncbi:uncharacterized protein E0L32_005645 [Thyridium curvatum]|uniref:Uncharacterized protein n=1 Tax=Thyridium curvatum TaxID=1093900 RepID=A0A507AT08_9PEZI|nr:uncharacterized protein E0L32_005645 [Thyridium curvatum]TPX13945.1 hypothetical protein E0L32_005645 [Thyridium curvatum]
MSDLPSRIPAPPNPGDARSLAPDDRGVSCRRSVHLEAASVGLEPPPRPAEAPVGVAGLDPSTTAAPAQRRPRRRLSQDLSEEEDPEEDSALSASFVHRRSVSFAEPARREPPHPAVRISKRTHSAILWTLEEALRQPYPFSPDLEEETASMADLLGTPGGPAVSNGHDIPSTRPTAPPQTSSPAQGIKGPRMIMRERQEREARQKAERERLERERERERAEQEARIAEEQFRQAAAEREQRAAAAPSAAAQAPAQEVDPAIQRRQQRAAEAQRASAAYSHAAPPAQAPAPQQQQQQQRTSRPADAPVGGPAAPAPSSVPLGPSGVQAGESSGAAGNRPRNSFPHAFERWEALSAHWEGLTSFWIRRLQQNTDEIDRDPLSQQLSRQVTDLSAAGANLFHAVVELQKLRASSERKFQRWFFETRAELERHQEVNGVLEAALEDERRGRAGAIRDAVEQERAASKTQRQLAEMRKELAISKEEARRAWEELGRREQEERDRTTSLQEGLPTIVGGVQVVPMTQGIPSRQGSSARDPRAVQQQAQQQQQAESSSRRQGQGQSQPAAQQQAAPSGGGAYGQPEMGHPEDDGRYGGQGSEGGYSEEEYETPGAQPGVSYPPSSSQQQYYSGGPDYAGQGYAAPGWETVPRHHHPTRLSDVIEEDDERSRTSASQVSRP